MAEGVNLTLRFRIEKPFKHILEAFYSCHAGVTIGLGETAPLNLGQS